MPAIPCGQTTERCRATDPSRPFDEATGCRYCWLAGTSANARRHWGLAPDDTLAPVPSLLVEDEDCPHLGGPTGETVRCPSCKGHVEVKLFACGVYGECTTHKTIEGTACCRTLGGCPGRTARPRASQQTQQQEAAKVRRTNHRPGMQWAVGLTTVPSRRDNLLPRTLESLKGAGFESPRLFLDGAENREAAWWEDQYGLEVTVRTPRDRTRARRRNATWPPYGLGTFGNWVLGLAELYIRQPQADRYAMFQDDLVAVGNLRQYLESCTYPNGQDRRPKGYWNLTTFPENQALAPRNEHGGTIEGWFRSNGKGRGAVALVFNREALTRLLTSYERIIDRPLTAGPRAYMAIDGATVDALRKQGWHEFCHSPSLVCHTGQTDHDSTMGHRPFELPESFPGEGWDATRLIGAASGF